MKKKGTNQNHRVVDTLCKGVDLTDDAREHCVQRTIDALVAGENVDHERLVKVFLCKQGALPFPARGVASESSPK